MSKVLIIDDDLTNIFALKAILHSRGWETATASHARAGLSLLNQDKDIAIVLLDMMMPDIDGYETIGLIKKQQQLQHIPVIAVTAQAMMGDREKCLEAGADDYVSKPIDVDKLFGLLQNYSNRAGWNGH